MFLLITSVATVRPDDHVMAASTEAASDGQATQAASLKPVAASADIPFSSYEADSEQQLLALANQSRQQAGAPPLKMDAGLSQAARLHAQAMIRAHQLSHQFDGEPSLPQRLAAATTLQLDADGENVAFDSDAAAGHAHLMLSPPHRANLLNPEYNVVGMGAIRSGDRLYIVEDFGHSVPGYSMTQWKDRIASAVNRGRQQASQPALKRRDLLNADDAACSMLQADKLGTAAVHKLAERFTVLTYTSLHPETLPNGANQAIAGQNLESFSIGACYGRSQTYTTGMYWVVLTLN